MRDTTPEEKEIIDSLNSNETRKLKSWGHDVKVTRSIVHKKRIAPKGYVFFVATFKTKQKIYSMSQLVNTFGKTEEEETQIKKELSEQLIKHFKL